MEKVFYWSLRHHLETYPDELHVLCYEIVVSLSCNKQYVMLLTDNVIVYIFYVLGRQFQYVNLDGIHNSNLIVSKGLCN
jgi:hypothetical protein